MEKINTNSNLSKILSEMIVLNFDDISGFDIGKTFEKNKIDNSDGFIIGIHGEWGTGKTTFIKFLKSNLEKSNKKNDINIFSVNAWEFNKEKKDELWMSIISYFYLNILEEIIEDLKKIDKNLINKKIIISKVKGLIHLLKKGFIKSGVKYNGIVKVYLKLPEIFSTIFDNILLFFGNFSNYFNNLKLDISNIKIVKENLIDLLKNDYNVKQKYIFIVEDLDRCSPKEVVNILDGLKIFLDIPNVIIIVAVDRNHIEKGIYEVYNKEILDDRYGVDPNEYIEKIIHLPIDIFSYSNIDLIPEEEKDSSSKEIEITDPIFDDSILLKNITPRKQLRIKRIYKFYYQYFKNFYPNDFSEYDLSKWILFKSLWPEYFKIIDKFPLFLAFPKVFSFALSKGGEDKNEILKRVIEILGIRYKNNDSNDYFKDINYVDYNKLQSFIETYNKFWGDVESIELNTILTYKTGINFNNNFEYNKNYIQTILSEVISFNEYWGGEKFVKELINRSLETDIIKDNLDIIEKNKVIFDLIKKDSIDENSEGFNLEENSEGFNLEENINNDLNISKYVLNDKILIKSLNEYLFDLNKISLNLHTKGRFGLLSENELKEKDPYRYLINSSIFMKEVLDNIDIFLNFNSSSNEKISTLVTDKTPILKKLCNDNNHVLSSLSKSDNKTFFGELINQMSFAKFGVSIGGNVGATDYIQLESNIFKFINQIEDILEKEQFIENIKNKLKESIFVNGNNVSQQLNKYKNLMEFLGYDRSNISNKNNIEEITNISRLYKRSLTIFSFFWYYQKPDLFSLYFSDSKDILEKYYGWNRDSMTLNSSLDSYAKFCTIISDFINIVFNEKTYYNDIVSKVEKLIDEHKEDNTNIEYFLKNRLIEGYLYHYKKDENLIINSVNDLKSIFSGPANLPQVFYIIKNKNKIWERESRENYSPDILYSWAFDFIKILKIATEYNKENNKIILTDEGNQIYEIIKHVNNDLLHGYETKTKGFNVKKYKEELFSKINDSNKNDSNKLIEILRNLLINTVGFNKIKNILDENEGEIERIKLFEILSKDLDVSIGTLGNRVPSMLQLAEFIGLLEIDKNIIKTKKRD